MSNSKPRGLRDFLLEALSIFIIMMSVNTLMYLNKALLQYLYGIDSWMHNVLVLVVLTFSLIVANIKD